MDKCRDQDPASFLVRPQIAAAFDAEWHLLKKPNSCKRIYRILSGIPECAKENRRCLFLCRVRPAVARNSVGADRKRENRVAPLYLRKRVRCRASWCRCSAAF